MDLVIKEADGTERTISDDAVVLPEGHFIGTDSAYVARESLKDTYVLKANFDRRFKNWVPKDKAAEDEDVRKAVLSEHGQTADLEDAKKQWREGELNPVLTRLNGLHGRLKAQETKESAAEYFDERFVKAPAPGLTSWAETTFGPMFKFDDDAGYTIALDSEGRPLAAANPTGLRPFMGVSERMGQIANDPMWKPYLKPDPKNDGGSGFAQNNGKGATSFPPRKSMSAAQKAKAVQELGVNGFLALP
jgi:hypothetical protein